MGAPGFWDDPESAAKVGAEHTRIQRRLDHFTKLEADAATGGLLFDVVEVIERVERHALPRGHRSPRRTDRTGPRRPVARGKASRDKRSRRRN